MQGKLTTEALPESLFNDLEANSDKLIDAIISKPGTDETSAQRTTTNRAVKELILPPSQSQQRILARLSGIRLGPSPTIVYPDRSDWNKPEAE